VRRTVRKVLHWLARPPLLGGGYLVALAFRAAQTPTIDRGDAGNEAAKLEAFVHARYATEIGRVGLAIGAAAFLVGAALGVAASVLIALRARLGARPPRTILGRAALVLALVAALHAALEGWAMARAPQLYAAAWYARGGWHRTVQVLVTDVLGPSGVTLLTALGCGAFLAGPPSQWGRWPGRAGRAFRGALAWGRRVRAAGVLVAPVLLFGAVVAFGVFALARVPSASARSAGHDARPNILVLAADSLRADRLDTRTAPHLTALADRGTRFEHAYVSLPRTFPSWVTILTGRHPHHHGIRSMFPRWEERSRDFDAVPERLARAGWATGVVSDYAGDIFSRIDLGFGTVDVPEFDFRQLVRQRALERETPLLPVLHSRWGRAFFPVLREMNDAADPAMLARDAVRAMRRLEQRPGPFCLVVFFSTAHFPYAAPSPYYRTFADEAYRGRFKYHKPVGLGQEAPADARDEQQVRALYDGAVRAVDDAAQTILDALDADGQTQRTIVVVTGDHGETLYDNGHGLGHGDHLFGDEGTHVPLVVVDPRQPGGRREGTIARDVDIAPTLYALTGVPSPGDLDGRSLAPALAGEPLAPANAYAETELWFTEDIPALSRELRLPYPDIARLTEVDTQHGDELVLRSDMRALTVVAKHRMVRDDRWKLLYVPARTGVRWMLFDTRDDPAETRDVAASHADVVARLQGELWSWMRSDPEMVERAGYLVPRDENASAAGAGAGGLVRLEDGSGRD
jgi:arylsulfatase A-like enzyme